MDANPRRDEDVISLRVPKTVTAAVKTIAARESETAASIFRKLIKAGLAHERRSADGER